MAKASDYAATLTFSVDDLPEPDERMAASMASLGYATRLYMRKVARDLGMTTLPGFQIGIGSRGGPVTQVQAPEEDLTVLLPGEEP